MDIHQFLQPTRAAKRTLCKTPSLRPLSERLQIKLQTKAQRNDTDGLCTLRNLFTYLTTLSATYTSRKLIWVWHVARIGDRCIRVFLGGG